MWVCMAVWHGKHVIISKYSEPFQFFLFIIIYNIRKIQPQMSNPQARRPRPPAPNIPLLSNILRNSSIVPQPIRTSYKTNYYLFTTLKQSLFLAAGAYLMYNITFFKKRWFKLTTNYRVVFHRYLFMCLIWFCSQDLYVRYTIKEYVKVRGVVQDNWNFVMKELGVQGRFRKEIGKSDKLDQSINDDQKYSTTNPDNH